jgi:hypothetical protein
MYIRWPHIMAHRHPFEPRDRSPDFQSRSSQFPTHLPNVVQSTPGRVMGSRKGEPWAKFRNSDPKSQSNLKMAMKNYPKKYHYYRWFPFKHTPVTFQSRDFQPEGNHGRSPWGIPHFPWARPPTCLLISANGRGEHHWASQKLMCDTRPGKRLHNYRKIHRF